MVLPTVHRTLISTQPLGTICGGLIPSLDLDLTSMQILFQSIRKVSLFSEFLVYSSAKDVGVLHLS